MVSELIKIIDTYKMDTKVLAASFKNAQQVIELMEQGCIVLQYHMIFVNL